MIARNKNEMRIRRILKFVQDAPGSTRSAVEKQSGAVSVTCRRIDACVTAGALVEERGVVVAAGRKPRLLTCSDCVGDLDTIDGLPADMAAAIFDALKTGFVRE